MTLPIVGPAAERHILPPTLKAIRKTRHFSLLTSIFPHRKRRSGCLGRKVLSQTLGLNQAQPERIDNLESRFTCVPPQGFLVPLAIRRYFADVHRIAGRATVSTNRQAGDLVQAESEGQLGL